ncbi:hypothetical protein K502DRAFT_323526 [Neoconidiobolus thromboides FSU 785]|nr:hypothetical protein K502DRAFT_323526 [Neoconidiobolus thromboides FSU 785]
MANLLDSVTYIFKKNNIDSGQELNIQLILNTFEEINKTKKLLDNNHYTQLRRFSNEHPTLKLNALDTLDLINKIVSGDFQTNGKSELKTFFSMPIKGKQRRSSILSEKAKFCPLPDSSLGVSLGRFRRPESPLNSLENSSRFLNSEVNPRSLERPLSPFDPDVGRLHRSTSFKSMKKSSIKSLHEKFEKDNDTGYVPIRSPSFDISIIKNDSGFNGIEDHRKIKKATSFLSQKLEYTEDSLSEMVTESDNKIKELEKENRKLKQDLYLKTKEASEQQGFINKQQTKVSILEKEQADDKESLNHYKKLYFQKKKQYEEAIHSNKKEAEIKKLKIEELENGLKAMRAVNLEYQTLILQANSMKKRIAALEKDVQIAQSVAKNFDEVVQENYQMKILVENLQKSLSEANSAPIPPSTREVEDYTPKEEIGNPLELPQDNLTILNNFNPINEKMTAKAMKELERENKYLKRNIEKTWSQWDKLKFGFLKIPGLEANVKSSQINVKELLNKMEMHRPNKAFPVFQRASIQHVIIDDRPFLSPTELSEMSRSLSEEAEMRSQNLMPQFEFDEANKKLNVEIEKEKSSEVPDIIIEQRKGQTPDILVETSNDNEIKVEEKEKEQKQETVESNKELKTVDEEIKEDLSAPFLSTSHSSTNSYHSLSSQVEHSNTFTKSTQLSKMSSNSSLSSTEQPDNSTSRSNTPSSTTSNKRNDLAPLPRPISLSTMSPNNTGSFRNRKNKNRNSRVIRQVSFSDLIDGENLISTPTLASSLLVSPIVEEPSNEARNPENDTNEIKVKVNNENSEYFSNRFKIGDLYTSNVLGKSELSPLSSGNKIKESSLAKEEKSDMTPMYMMVVYYIVAYLLTFITSDESKKESLSDPQEKNILSRNNTKKGRINENRAHRIDSSSIEIRENSFDEEANSKDSNSVFHFWLQALILGSRGNEE